MFTSITVQSIAHRYISAASASSRRCRKLLPALAQPAMAKPLTGSLSAAELRRVVAEMVG